MDRGRPGRITIFVALLAEDAALEPMPTDMGAFWRSEIRFAGEP